MFFTSLVREQKQDLFKQSHNTVAIVVMASAFILVTFLSLVIFELALPSRLIFLKMKKLD